MTLIRRVNYMHTAKNLSRSEIDLPEEIALGEMDNVREIGRPSWEWLGCGNQDGGREDELRSGR